jgi:hypothetical protein
MSAMRSAAERRSVYRVQPATTDGLRAVILANGKAVAVREIIDIAITGAAMRPVEEHLHDLPVGAGVQVSLVAPELAKPVKLAAVVIAQEAHNGAGFCRFRFTERFDPDGWTAREFFRLLNRRSVYRGIKPLDEDALQMEIGALAGAGEFRVVRLRNLSSTGACITVDASIDDWLRPHREVLVRLKLPDNPRLLLLPARLRGRYLCAEGFLYGVQFDWTRAEDPLAQAEDVLSYVLSRFAGQGNSATLH